LHSLTVAAISPKQGIKALGLVSPMLIIANLPDSASRLLAIKRLSKISLIPEEDLLNLVKYIDESGRNIIDTQIIELQAPQKFGVASNLSGRALENVKPNVQT
jgi:hypothetical protein